jgi:signal transduction histidine kinase
MFLIIASARRSERNLYETIAIRFENDALLRELESEKESAVAAARTAQEANRSKSLFMAAASHDLRQPLYAISLLAETLALHDLPEPAKAIVEQQEQSLGALRRMFDDLLDLSRFDSGDVKPRIGPVFLTDILAGLYREYRPLCESKGLRFETEEAEAFVSTDFDLLGRLLRNLIGNAVRYTDAGTVRVSSRAVGDAVFVEIADTGRGIDPADQQRIFQEFVQLDNPERNREKGVGLGLSIVQRIANLLGHEVRLVSEPKRGTLVTVQLPRVDGLPEQREGGPRQAAEVPAVRLGTYVWIVEDDALVRSALATHLGTLSIRHDFAVDRADLEALAAVSGWPDYVLLDDMLGRAETGLDLANWLADRVPPERILLVTGNTEPERLRELHESRFRVLRKPVSSDDLIGWMRGDSR